MTRTQIHRGDFNPRSPRGERLFRTSAARTLAMDFNPRSPRGERRVKASWSPRQEGISTHAPLAGSDVGAVYPLPSSFHFNPRSPRGERLGCSLLMASSCVISTHAPLAGSDERGIGTMSEKQKFQPTLPSRGATRSFYFWAEGGKFQPTLPSRGATGAQTRAGRENADFNPRSPRGERRSPAAPPRWSKAFQPTLPSRGATATGMRDRFAYPFQPTLPSRGATCCFADVAIPLNISTHAPLAGSDSKNSQILQVKFQQKH